MPLNIPVTRKGKKYRVSLIPVIGLVSAMIVWFVIVGLHPTGRLVGSIWFAIGIAGYLIYQKWGRRHKPDV